MVTGTVADRELVTKVASRDQNHLQRIDEPTADQAANIDAGLGKRRFGALNVEGEPQQYAGKRAWQNLGVEGEFEHGFPVRYADNSRPVGRA
ncbi:MAG TPA: hypothetical protein VLU73_05995 [Methylococcaceae bacterium]|jgi:hypothetical protein|nr:hypothetical protein [Methylococcaceae bacterium]